MKKGKEQWEGEMREFVKNFIDAKAAARDEAALLWLVQRAIVGLLLVGVDPGVIRSRVDAALPPRKEG